MAAQCFPIVKRDDAGKIMTIFAVFTTREAAEDAAANANQWYGPDHPLTPLEVVDDRTLWLDPRKFPNQDEPTALEQGMLKIYAAAARFKQKQEEQMKADPEAYETCTADDFALWFAEFGMDDA